MTRELKSRTQDAYSKFPRQLQVSKANLVACKDDQLMWRLLMVRFDYLRMNFLLERLATERQGANRRTLLEVARESAGLDGVSVVRARPLCVPQARLRLIVPSQPVPLIQLPLTRPTIMCYGMPNIGIYARNS